MESVWVLAVLGCAVIAYYACRTPEPARTALALASGLCSGSRAERQDLISAHVAPVLEIEVAGEETRSLARRALAQQLDELRAHSRGCELSLRDWEVRSGTGGAAWVEGVIEYSASQPSDLHALRRRVRALFAPASARSEGRRGSDGRPRSDTQGPQLERVVLGRLERREPEARP